MADHRRAKRYELFRAKRFNLTECYESEELLTRCPPRFDAYVVGSDQVWNCEQGINPVWLLNFVQSGRRTAYAPSFGTASVDESAREIFCRHLPKFDALSCREDSGVEMIRSMTGLQAEQVLDPTLLLPAEEWSTISKDPKIKHPYLLVYCLAESPEFMRVVAGLVEKTGLCPVFISKHDCGRFCGQKVIRVRDAGPAEFLGLFKNATLVCTNSFHGVAFSINFRKTFFSLRLESRNTRLESLLKLLGLEGRLLNCAADLDRFEAGRWDVDYGPVQDRLQKAADRSRDYLRNALG
jgi:hypothetical protein